MLKIFILGLLCISFTETKDPAIEEEELEALRFLEVINQKTEKDGNRKSLAKWAYESNLTEENLQHKLDVSAEVAKHKKETWEEVKQYDWQKFSDYSVRRQFSKYAILGTPALPEDKYKRLIKITSDMLAVYAKGKVCDFQDSKKCDLALEPDLTRIISTSRNADELKHVWVQWRDAVGPTNRNLYREYVQLSNEAARLNNFTDQSDFWLHKYEDPNFKEKIHGLWEQLKPLYLQMHAYVRHQLRQKYADIVSEKGPIPAHLLGDMWGQEWSNIEDFTLPFPGVANENLTLELIKQNYTPIGFFKTAEDFFKSINLTELPQSFWEKSILVKPNDIDIVCHASAWDFRDGQDVRIKQCTEITKDHFITAHHEMGHIEYYLQYKEQPIKFRQGANDGFHEAIGDLISLSVSSSKHLRKLGLMKSQQDDPKISLNNLYKIGLDKIAFLPFGYLMDLWRWDVFSGKTKPEDYNCKWWELREKYQGVEAPVDRSEEDFDPAAKYHIIASVSYLRYFISYVIQFQFHRALCEKAGQYDPNDASKPLHECDIYQSTEAGNALKKMLALGSSRPWPDAMEALTGQRNMDAGGVLEYFKPLQIWLEKENEKNGAFIGWEKSKRVCVRTKRKEAETKREE